MNRPKSSKQRTSINFKNYYRRWVAASLVAGGLFQLAAPVLAEGTPAGTTISNTATGTYDDGTGISIETTSNTVEITVAEVAGVTVQNAGIDNVTTPTTALKPGDTADFKFNVTNTGNDPSKFFIPSAIVLNGASAVVNGSATSVSYVVLNPDGTVNTTATPLPISVTGNGIETLSLAPNEQIRVIVRMNIPSTIPGTETVSVTLGNTLTIGDQNVPRGANANDVYTVDNPDGAPGETAGVPVNGVREASSLQERQLNYNPKEPFVKITKTNSNYAQVSPLGPENDTLTYNLAGEVAASAPAGALPGVEAGDLHPTYVDGLTSKHVLISDVIPAGTELNANPTASGNWTPVYSTTSLTTPARQASWSTTPPALNTVKRVGFIYSADTAVPAGTTIPTLSFTVKFTSAVEQGSSIYNIAQVFGEKDATSSTSASSSTTPSAFDESGDNSYNNDSNGDGVADYDAEQTTGVADHVNQGIDQNNNNTGQGPGGEDNVYTVPLTDAGILNGTVNVSGTPAVTTLRPDAKGPDGDINTDFTNGASRVTPNTVPLVTFTNSVRNTSTAAADLKLIPLGTNLRDLPVGTTIITTGATGLTTVTYTFNQAVAGGIPTLVSASGTPLTFTNVPQHPATGATQAQLDASTRQYAVTVDLPDTAPQNQGYDVPITAFIDNVTANNQPDASEAQNITIDRVYAGFVALLKETRILQSRTNLTPVSDSRGTWSTLPKQAAVGQNPEVVEYRVTYKNISEENPASPAQYNVILNAKNLKITEDGTTGGNNWALDSDGDGNINTVHVLGTAGTNTPTFEFFNGSLSLGSSDPATGAAVTKYTSTLPASFSLAPQASGTFTFQREMK